MVRLRHSLLRPRRFRSLAAALLAAALAAVLPAGAVAAAPPYTLEERAAAIASPALVFLDVEFEGYVRRTDTGTVIDDNPVRIRIQCSGMVVGPDGHVATTAFCLDNSSSRWLGLATGIIAERRMRASQLTPAQRDAFLADVRAVTEFTGPSAGSPAGVTVAAQMYFATNDLAQAKVISAQIVRAPRATGSLSALVKLDATGLPVARLRSEVSLNPGTPVVVLGWGSAVPANTTPASYPVLWQPATVVGRVGDDVPPLHRIDVDLGSGAQGGMAVDSEGQVLGMLATDRSGGYSFTTESLDILNLLAATGVANQQTPADEEYRRGLDAYFGGNYRDAIEAFDSVVADQPNNMAARNYRDQASGRLALEGENGTFNGVWVVLGVAAAGVALVVMAVLLILRGRHMQALERELDDYEPPAITATAVAGAALPGGHAMPTMPTGGYPMVALPAAAQPVPPPGGSWPPPPQPMPLPPQPGHPPAQPSPTPYDGGWIPPTQPAAPQYEGGWIPPTQPAGPQYDGGWGPPAEPTVPPTAASQPAQAPEPSQPSADADAVHSHYPTDWPAEALWRQSPDPGPVPSPGPAPSPQRDQA